MSKLKTIPNERREQLWEDYLGLRRRAESGVDAMASIIQNPIFLDEDALFSAEQSLRDISSLLKIAFDQYIEAVAASFVESDEPEFEEVHEDEPSAPEGGVPNAC